MAFFLLCIAVFIMFFQPTSVFPELVPYSPLKNSAIIAFIAYIPAANKSDIPFFENKINRYFLGFVLMSIMSAAFFWLQAGLEMFNVWLRYGIVYFLIIKSCTDESRLRKLTLMIVLAIGYLCYYSISNFALAYEPGVRASGFGWYENANDLSLILVSTIPLIFLLAETSRYAIMRYLYIFIAAAFSFNVLFTGSRNGLLGLAGVGILSIVSTRRFSKGIKTGLLTLLIISIFTVGIVTVLNREDLSSLGGDASSEDRKVQWKAGIRMLIANPLFGVGPNQFESVAVDYQGIRGLAPHNTLVQVFSETGLPGGIFFFLFACFPLWEALKYIREKRYEDETYPFIFIKYLTISLFGFWICAFFSNRDQSYILYVLIALIVAVSNNLIMAVEHENAKEDNELDFHSQNYEVNY
ncbi:hypothetical protein GF337_03235 [candidate division KSB1 bacterium]|nr:hypothetical protein [candidate division KSB1 bacterium]